MRLLGAIEPNSTAYEMSMFNFAKHLAPVVSGTAMHKQKLNYPICNACVYDREKSDKGAETVNQHFRSKWLVEMQRNLLKSCCGPFVTLAQAEQGWLPGMGLNHVFLTV